MSEKSDHLVEAMLILAAALILQLITGLTPPTWPFRIYLTHMGLTSLTILLVASGKLELRIYRLPRKGDILSILALSTATILAAQAAAYTLFYTYTPPPEYLERLRSLIPLSPTSLLLATLITWLLVAPAEESIFRGVIFGKMERALGYRRALAYSAVIFALAHLDLWRIPSTLIVGLTTAIIYHKTGTLTSSIIIHAVNNTASLTLSYMIP